MQRVNNMNYVYAFLLITLCTVIVFLVLPSNNKKGLQAQEDLSNMRSLIARFHDEMAINEDFQVAIRLRTPIIQGEEVLIVPDRREDIDDEVSRVISEIGEDYICFDTLGGSARFIECVPFSNIASIRYLVD